MINANFSDNFSLAGKTVAVTGSTGGLGKEICKKMAFLGADLILINRSKKATNEQIKYLKQQYPAVNAGYLHIDLADEKSVSDCCDKLKGLKIDYLVLNSGIYAVPKVKCKSGFNNIFQVNFLSNYYIVNRLMPKIKSENIKVTVVGSIAHRYSKSNTNDTDFSGKKSYSKVYGNSKRYLMFAFWELFKEEGYSDFSVGHPGVTFTGITAHYPKLIFALIKRPMKIIFPPPKRAVESIVCAVIKKCGYKEWFGPSFLDVWGRPNSKKIKGCDQKESRQIFKAANDALEMYKSVIENKT